MPRRFMQWTVVRAIKASPRVPTARPELTRAEGMARTPMPIFPFTRCSTAASSLIFSPSETPDLALSFSSVAF